MITASTISKYKNVFGTPEGQEVLADLLTELSFFDAAIETEAQRIGINFAHLVLAKLGAWDQRNADGFISAILAMPAYPQEDQDGSNIE
jgi:hypothetical protein